jgi:hypothetical protein
MEHLLVVKWPDAPAQIYRSGNDYLYDVAAFTSYARRPSKGIWRLCQFIQEFCFDLICKLTRRKPTAEMLDFPNVTDEGMAFIESVIASGKSDKKWFDFKI